tara:strand:+ start:286 stop:450 length:165 start_codon:yes stop_codon:yes gene_type:complete
MVEVTQQAKIIIGFITFVIFIVLIIRTIKNISSANDEGDIIIDLDKVKKKNREK